MGQCTCGRETVWNDMCEDCLHEYKDRIYSDLFTKQCISEESHPIPDDDGLGQELLRAMETVDKQKVTSILRSNLMDALNAAIHYYTDRGLGESCAVAGYREVLEALRAGKHVEVRE